MLAQLGILMTTVQYFSLIASLRTRPILQVGSTDLWFADLDLTSLQGNNFKGLTEPAEIIRSQAIGDLAQRERFILSRIILREILSLYLQKPPTTLKFIFGPHSRPALESGDLEFNYSHSKSLFLLAVANIAPLGVDIEAPRCVSAAEQIAKRVFSESECKSLHEASLKSNIARDNFFLNCWTRKEAVLKSMGTGFTFPAKDITVGVEPLELLVPAHADIYPSVKVLTLEIPVHGTAALAFAPTQKLGNAFHIKTWPLLLNMGS